MKSIFYLTISALSLLLAAGGCGDKIDAVQTGPCNGFDGTVTYTEHIAPLLTTCAACHTGSAAQAGVLMDSYANAKKNADLADDAIQSGRMPQGAPLAAEERDLFCQWIADGLVR